MDGVQRAVVYFVSISATRRGAGVEPKMITQQSLVLSANVAGCRHAPPVHTASDPIGVQRLGVIDVGVLQPD